MPIRERNGGWQVDVWVKGLKRVRTQCIGSKLDAAKLEAEIRLSLLRDGRWSPKVENLGPQGRTSAGPTVLRDGLERAKAAWKATAKPKFAKSSERDVKEFVSALGLDDVTLDDVGFEEIGKVVGWYRSKGLSDGTINVKLSAVSTIFRVCRSAPVLTKNNPDFKQWRPKGIVEADRVMTDAEEAELVPYFRSLGRDEFADMCIMALDLALHAGEVRALRVSHFEGLDGPDPTCHVPGTKTEYRAAALPMTPRAVEAAKRRIAEARARRITLLFPSYSGSQHQVTRAWNKFRDYLGLQDDRWFTFKVLRHTCGTRLADMDVNAFKIRDFMRHGDIATTERYVHGSRKRLRGLAEGLADGRYRQKKEMVDVGKGN
jgi:integrase